MLLGFNSKLSRTHSKLSYYEKYYEKLPELLNTETKEISKTLLNNGVPEVYSDSYTIKKMKHVLSKINAENQFVIIKIQKIIFDLEKVQKTHQLYEI